MCNLDTINIFNPSTKYTMMENNDFTSTDIRECEYHESLSSDDWDIIDEMHVKVAENNTQYDSCDGDNSDGKCDNNDAVNYSCDGDDSDEKCDKNATQNICKSIKLRRRRVAFSKDKIKENDSKHLEDSDGISVITDTETDFSIVNRKVALQNEPVKSTNELIRKTEIFNEEVSLKVGVFMIIVIVCSLGTLIALDTLNLYNEYTFKANKLESIDKVNRALFKLNENILETEKLYQSILQERKKDTLQQMFVEYQTSNVISKTCSTDPDMKSLRQLKSFYNTLCSIFNRLQEGSHTEKIEIRMIPSIILDFVNFKISLNTMLNNLKDTDKFLEISFLEKTDVKINSVCQSLLADLSNLMQNLMKKISNKLEYEKNNLNKKLCDLQGEIIGETDFPKTFGNATTFLNDCDTMLNTHSLASQPNVKIQDVDADAQSSGDSLKLFPETNIVDKGFKEKDTSEIIISINDRYEPDLSPNKTFKNEVTDKRSKKRFVNISNNIKKNKKHRHKKTKFEKKKSNSVKESVKLNKKIEKGEIDNKNKGKKDKKLKHHSKNPQYLNTKKVSKPKKKINKKKEKDGFNVSRQFQRSRERKKHQNFASHPIYLNKYWYLQRAGLRLHA